MACAIDSVRCKPSPSARVRFRRKAAVQEGAAAHLQDCVWFEMTPFFALGRVEPGDQRPERPGVAGGTVWVRQTRLARVHPRRRNEVRGKWRLRPKVEAVLQPSSAIFPRPIVRKGDRPAVERRPADHGAHAAEPLLRREVDADLSLNFGSEHFQRGHVRVLHRIVHGPRLPEDEPSLLLRVVRRAGHHDAFGL